MNSFFLLFNCILLLLPFVFSLDKNNFSIKQAISAIVPSIIVTLIFSVIAIFLTDLQVWSFTSAHLIGVNFIALPLAQYLFFFTFSFAGLGIYNYLNAKFSNNDWQKYSLTFSNLMLGICVAILFFFYAKWYTVLTFGILFLVLLYVEYVGKLRFMYRFYRAYLVCLLPFYGYYGLLSKLSVISYKADETMQLNITNIPIEGFFYIMGMLLLGTYLMEFFKARDSK